MQDERWADAEGHADCGDCELQAGRSQEWTSQGEIGALMPLGVLRADENLGRYMSYPNL